jgi:hypothetical protein
MPKQSKNSAQPKPKSQTKTKQKTQPEAPGITTKKWYWIMLAGVMVTVFSIIGYMMALTISEIAILMLTITFLIGLIGYVRTTPSTLSMSKRATFLFVGASIIGFSIWAAIALAATFAGLIENIFGGGFFIIPSLIICLIIGAFIGELLSQNSRVQTLFFKPENAI